MQLKHCFLLSSLSEAALGGVPERLWMGGMSHRMYQSTGLGQMNSARLKLAGTHKIAVKNLEQTGADL